MRFAVVRLSPVQLFAIKYGRPEPTDIEANKSWLETSLPTSQPVRRMAALYLLATFGNFCELCGLEIDADLEDEPRHPGRVQIDHVVPTSRGGEDKWGNVRAVHAVCNAERRDERVPVDDRWFRELLAAELEAWRGNTNKADVLYLRIQHFSEAVERVERELLVEEASHLPDIERVRALKEKRAEFECRRNWALSRLEGAEIGGQTEEKRGSSMIAGSGNATSRTSVVSRSEEAISQTHLHVKQGEIAHITNPRGFPGDVVEDTNSAIRAARRSLQPRKGLIRAVGMTANTMIISFTQLSK